MKHIFFVIALSFLSVSACAETNRNVDNLTAEFTKAMGIDSMLESTMKQTDESLKANMADMTKNMLMQYPDISDERKKELDKIFTTYIESILNSVDTAKAAHIYAGIIAERLPENEIKTAIEYYKSSGGQNLLKVVGIASTELNNYILNQMGEATKVGQVQLMKDIRELRENWTATQAK